MKVHEKVRIYIDENGFKQNAVAKKTNIPIATFNAILHGKRTMYAEDLRAICQALNVSPEIFVDCNPKDQKAIEAVSEGVPA